MLDDNRDAPARPGTVLAAPAELPLASFRTATLPSKSPCSWKSGRSSCGATEAPRAPPAATGACSSTSRPSRALPFATICGECVGGGGRGRVGVGGLCSRVANAEGGIPSPLPTDGEPLVAAVPAFGAAAAALAASRCFLALATCLTRASISISSASLPGPPSSSTRAALREASACDTKQRVRRG